MEFGTLISLVAILGLLRNAADGSALVSPAVAAKIGGQGIATRSQTAGMPIYPPGPGEMEKLRRPTTMKPPQPPGPDDSKEVSLPPDISSTPDPEVGPPPPPPNCNATVRRYMDHDTAVAELIMSGVTIKALTNTGELCIQRSISYCTSLIGVRQESVEGIQKFAQKSGCRMAVIEGTEVGLGNSRCSHKKGWRLSILKNDCINSFINKNLKKKSRQHYRDDDNNLYTEYKNKWNILFNPKYECPCDRTPPDQVTFSHDEARESFDNNYVVTTNEFKELSPCSTHDISYCTYYGGLRHEAVSGIIGLKAKSKCDVEIIGAKEVTKYHAGCSYRNGLQLSVRKNDCLDKYIMEQLVKRSRQHYTDESGNLFIDFGKSWDVQFRSTEKTYCSLDSLDSQVFEHNDAREIFDNVYIVTTDGHSRLSACAVKKTGYCTYYGGIRRTVISGIIELKNRTGCTIEIVDGTEKTEKANCWHSNGLELAIKKNKCLDDYILGRLVQLKRNGNTDDNNMYIPRKQSWGIRFRESEICPR